MIRCKADKFETDSRGGLDLVLPAGCLMIKFCGKDSVMFITK